MITDFSKTYLSAQRYHSIKHFSEFEENGGKNPLA